MSFVYSNLDLQGYTNTYSMSFVQLLSDPVSAWWGKSEIGTNYVVELCPIASGPALDSRYPYGNRGAAQAGANADMPSIGWRQLKVSPGNFNRHSSLADGTTLGLRTESLWDSQRTDAGWPGGAIWSAGAARWVGGGTAEAAGGRLWVRGFLGSIADVFDEEWPMRMGLRTAFSRLGRGASNFPGRPGHLPFSYKLLTYN